MSRMREVVVLGTFWCAMTAVGMSVPRQETSGPPRPRMAMRVDSTVPAEVSWWAPAGATCSTFSRQESCESSCRAEGGCCLAFDYTGGKARCTARTTSCTRRHGPAGPGC